MRFSILICLLFSIQISFAQSLISWSSTSEVASNQFGNQHPRIVSDGAGNPMVLWGDNNSKRVFFARWIGNGFSTPKVINPGSIPAFAASWAGPDIASHGDTVYIVFKETPEDTSGIYLVKSFDGGINFFDATRVDAIEDSISRFPALGTDEAGNPMVAFMKFNPGWGNARYVLARSNDFGDSFALDIPGSGFSGGTVCDCCPASLCSAGNTVALLYRDNLNDLRNSWAGISKDGGKTFAGGIEIDNTDWMISSCPSSGPDGVIIGDRLYSVFMSAATGKTLCYRSTSIHTSMQLENIEPLTGTIPGLGQQNFPRIGSAGEAAAISWVQSVNGTPQLAFQFTNNILNGFPNNYELIATNNVVNADLVLTKGKVYVVWENPSTGTINFKSGSFSTSPTHTPLIESSNFKIFPNPANATLELEFSNPAEETVQYQILNALGQIELQGYVNASTKNMKLNTSDLIPGAYFIRMYRQGRIETRSFFIQ